jgi:hypothetical protein
VPGTYGISPSSPGGGARHRDGRCRLGWVRVRLHRWHWRNVAVMIVGARIGLAATATTTATRAAGRRAWWDTADACAVTAWRRCEAVGRGVGVAEEPVM